MRGAAADARAPRVAAALLGGAIVLQALSLAQQTRAILSGAPARSAHAASAFSYAAAAHAIVAAHLFGAPPIEPAAADEPTSLQLTLLGTLAADDPEKGVAIIRAADSKAHTVAAGEQIDASSRLLRVYADRAVVEFRGSEQVLTFPRDKQLLALLQSQPGRTREAQSASPAEETLVRRPPPPPHTANFPTIMDNIDYNAQMVGNQVGGMEISSVKDPAALRKLGLREGDVVTAINGEPINSQARINELLHALSQGEPVNATIVRDGQVTTATPTTE